MVESNERVSETLRREFSEEALAKLDLPPEKRQAVAKKIEELFQHGTEVGQVNNSLCKHVEDKNSTRRVLSAAYSFPNRVVPF